jgi:hypothetical protein
LLRTRLEKQEARRDKISALWITGKGHVGDRSAWEAYNALTQATDHSEEDVFNLKGSRVQALTTGPLGETKARVYANLLGYATQEESLH